MKVFALMHKGVKSSFKSSPIVIPELEQIEQNSSLGHYPWKEKLPIAKPHDPLQRNYNRVFQLITLMIAQNANIKYAIPFKV